MEMRGYLKQRGLSLLEFTVVLSLLAGAAVLLMPSREEAPSFLQEEAVLDVVDQQLIYFITTRSRLPCPDHSGNGWEDCGAASGKGGLPFRTLGMSSASYGLADMPLLYGVYQNADTQLVERDSGSAFINDADLTANVNRYEPTMADGEWVSMENAAAPDFCAALSSARRLVREKPYSPSLTFVQDGGNLYNVAFAIASPGRYDSDGSNSLFDGLNGSHAHGFNSDTTPRTSNYDDRVRSRTFAELSARLECDSLLQSLNLIANGRQTEIEVADTLEGNIIDTSIGAAINGAGIVLNAVDVVQSAFTIISAATQLTTAIGLLAGAIGSCVLLVGCGAIPAYVASVAAATAGGVAGVAAVAATAVATGAQVATTALYIAAAVEMSLTDLDFEADMDDLDMVAILQENREEVEDELAALLVERQEVVAERDTAESAKNSSRNQIQSYMQENGAAGSDADVMQELEVARDETDRLNDSRALLQDKEAAYEAALADCEALSDGELPDEDMPDHEDIGNVELSCDQSVVDAARDEYDNANTNFQAQEQTRDNAISAAQSAARNFQVEIDTDEEGEPVYSPCSEVASCSLDTDIFQSTGSGDDEELSGYVPLAEVYLRRQSQLDNLDAQIANQNDTLDGIDGAIATTNCGDQGNVIDPDTGDCVSPDELQSSAPITSTPGAVQILNIVDGLHLMGQQ